MPVSGLVVTLARPDAAAQRALAWLHGDDRFAVGPAADAARRRLPVTLCTADPREDKACWQQLQDHPGVAFVDVSCVFFDHDDHDGAAPDHPGTDAVAPSPHARSRA